MSYFQGTCSSVQCTGPREAVVPWELTHAEGSKAERKFCLLQETFSLIYIVLCSWAQKSQEDHERCLVCPPAPRKGSCMEILPIFMEHATAIMGNLLGTYLSLRLK